MDSHSIKATKNINIIKYTMEDYPFMVSSIIAWISCEDNYSKLMYHISRIVRVGFYINIIYVFIRRIIVF